jgi:hypothetical protein
MRASGQGSVEVRRTARLVACAAIFGAVAAAGLDLALASGSNGGPETDGQRFVTTSLGGVVGAFNGLSRRPDALGFSREGLRAGTTCKHYQGEARVNGPDGTPYIILTKSGNHSACLLEDDEPGYLFVAKLGSRPKDGERLGSNLLPYGTSALTAQSPPATFAQDKIVRELVFDGTSLPAYRHPGGMQVVGNLLAVGAEQPFGNETTRATIMFFDVSDPTDPQYLGRFNPLSAADETCGILGCIFGTDPVGLTAIRAPDGTCCRYLMVAAGGDGNLEVRFFRSRGTSSADGPTTDLHHLQWDEVGRYGNVTLSNCIGQDWPTAGLIAQSQHQMLNFVREGSLDGQLYLIGGRRDGVIIDPTADEYLDLYKVNVSSTGIPDACPLSWLETKEMGDDPWGNEIRTSTFAAAAGVYVSPSGELIVYDTRHDAIITKGIIDEPLADHVALGEYRVSSLVRADSPQLKPTASVDGPFTVDEGSSVDLTGHGEQARQKAFVQLFEDDGVGLQLPGFLDSDEWISIDYSDRNADHFDDLSQLGGNASDIYENAGSLRWFAPVGCTISLNDYPISSGNWPGPDTVLLNGTGKFEEIQDLDNLKAYTPNGSLWPVTPVPNGVTATRTGYDDDIAGVTFYHQVPFGDAVARLHDCESYYNATVRLRWDLDGNGSFETSGNSVAFSAASLDGPTTVTVNAQAKHPTDDTALGTSPSVPVTVTVRNVPPQLGTETIVDSLGRDLTAAGSAALIGLPVTLSLSFTDPGVADTQTARIDWGDGNANTSFTTFSDAHGGATGHLQQAHTFASAGTFTITATVTDDDGGATPVSQTIHVLSPKDLIQNVADQLTQLIGSTSNAKVAAALRAARDELIGNHGGKPPTNGATDKLDANDPSGAITKLGNALGYLITAESLGAGDLTTLKDSLGLAAEAIATGVYQRAVTALPHPSAGQASTLNTIAALIAQGHQQLVAHQYQNACSSFRLASDKGLGLLK